MRPERWVLALAVLSGCALTIADAQPTAGVGMATFGAAVGAKTPTVTTNGVNSPTVDKQRQLNKSSAAADTPKSAATRKPDSTPAAEPSAIWPPNPAPVIWPPADPPKMAVPAPNAPVPAKPALASGPASIIQPSAPLSASTPVAPAISPAFGPANAAAVGAPVDTLAAPPTAIVPANPGLQGAMLPATVGTAPPPSAPPGQAGVLCCSDSQRARLAVIIHGCFLSQGRTASWWTRPLLCINAGTIPRFRRTKFALCCPRTTCRLALMARRTSKRVWASWLTYAGACLCLLTRQKVCC